MTQVQVPLQFFKKDSFTFDEFVGNQSVVESLAHHDKLPQFTYLWGEKFSGKSHLLAALENRLAINNKIYLSLDAEMIKDHDVTNNLPEQLAYLLINDVNQLQFDNTGELALFNLYNWCRSRDCRLIISAISSPRSELWQLPDLKSRLNSGLVLALKPLKGDLALDCISQQFVKHGIPLEPSVVNYLKTTQNTSYQYLYPLFLQIAAESLALKRKVTVPLVKKAIQDYQVSAL
jgi:DnaA family protein